jgi:hypothetical protein
VIAGACALAADITPNVARTNDRKNTNDEGRPAPDSVPWVNFPSFKLLSRKIVGFVSQIVYRIIQPGASDKWCIASGLRAAARISYLRSGTHCEVRTHRECRNLRRSRLSRAPFDLGLGVHDGMFFRNRICSKDKDPSFSAKQTLDERTGVIQAA